MSKLPVAKGDYALCTMDNDPEDPKTPYVLKRSQPKNYLLVEAVGPDVTRTKVGEHVIAVGQEFPTFEDQGVKYLLVQDHQIGATVE